MRSSSFSRVLPLLVLTAFSGGSAEAKDWKCDRLEEWIPADVIGYAKLEGLGSKVDSLLDSKFRARLEETAIGKFLLSQENYTQYLSELEKFEASAGVTALDFAKGVVGREVAFGGRVSFDGPQFIVLTRSPSPAELEKSLGIFRKVVVERVGGWPFTRLDSYQDVEIQGADQIAFATIGEVLVVSNKPSGIKKVIDLARGKVPSSLLKSKTYAPWVTSEKKSLLTAVVRPKFIPGFKVPERVDNFLVSLLFSGWLGAVQECNVIGAKLDAKSSGLELGVEIKIPEGALADKFASFRPALTPSPLFSKLQADGVVAAIQVHRNFADWWDIAEELVKERAHGDMRQFTQIMNIVFGGEFEDKVLEALQPTLTLVADRQLFKELDEKPRPALPGFAAILQMKDPDQYGKRFRIALQTLVGIINADMAQKGNTSGMLLVEPETVGKTTVYTVTRTEALNKEKPGLEFNFSPAVAIVGEHVVISSSKETARMLVGQLDGKSGKSKKKSSATDRLTLTAATIDKALHDNFEVLVAQQMVSDGKSKPEAENELNSMLELLDFLRDLRVDSRLTEEALKVRVSLRTATPGVTTTSK